MGFYLRKSFRLGPLRFNLSKRGVGISAGVNGLRAGVDARGKGYVAGGCGGLYFRERIPSAPTPQPSEAWRVPDTGSRLPGLVAIAVLGRVLLLFVLMRIGWR